MNFANEKKTFLAKADKSKKGEIDPLAIPIIDLINKKEQYYTTSSCSGRVYLWRGSGKKNELEWVKMSHDSVTAEFFEVGNFEEGKGALGLIWLRQEAFILHVACQDLGAAHKLLETARRLYKKSCILSASNKIIVELKGSELLEMPLYIDGKLVFSGDFQWLTELINNNFAKIWAGMQKFQICVQQL